MMVRTLSSFGLKGGRNFSLESPINFRLPQSPLILDPCTYLSDIHYFKVLATQMQTGMLPPANLRYLSRYTSNSIIIYKKILPPNPFPRKSHPTLTRRTKPHQPPSTTTIHPQHQPRRTLLHKSTTPSFAPLRNTCPHPTYPNQTPLFFTTRFHPTTTTGVSWNPSKGKLYAFGCDYRNHASLAREEDI